MLEVFRGVWLTTIEITFAQKQYLANTIKPYRIIFTHNPKNTETSVF